jgi:hypothetical protein
MDHFVAAPSVPGAGAKEKPCISSIALSGTHVNKEMVFSSERIGLATLPASGFGQDGRIEDAPRELADIDKGAAQKEAALKDALARDAAKAASAVVAALAGATASLEDMMPATAGGRALDVAGAEDADALACSFSVATVRQEPKNILYPLSVRASDLESWRSVCSFDYTPAHYKGNTRSDGNFIGSGYIVLDCDNDHSDNPNEWKTPEDFAALLPAVRVFVHYSRNHMREKDGKAARPRYHLAIMAWWEEDAARRKETSASLCSIFPFDKHCNPVGLFFGVENPSVEILSPDGGALTPGSLAKALALHGRPGTKTCESSGAPEAEERTWKGQERPGGMHTGAVICEGTRNDEMRSIAKWLFFNELKGWDDLGRIKAIYDECANRCEHDFGPEAEDIWARSLAWVKGIGWLPPENYRLAEAGRAFAETVQELRRIAETAFRESGLTAEALTKIHREARERGNAATPEEKAEALQLAAWASGACPKNEAERRIAALVRNYPRDTAKQRFHKLGVVQAAMNLIAEDLCLAGLDIRGAATATQEAARAVGLESGMDGSELDIYGMVDEAADLAQMAAHGGEPELHEGNVIKMHSAADTEAMITEGLTRHTDKNAFMKDQALFFSFFCITPESARIQALARLKETAATLGIKASDYNRLKKSYENEWQNDRRKHKSGALAHYEGNYTQFPGQPIKLKCGEWQTGASGVWHYKTLSDGQQEQEYIIRQPVTIDMIYINETTKEHNIQLCFVTEGTWKKIIVPQKSISSNDMLELSNAGLNANMKNVKELSGFLAGDLLGLNYCKGGLLQDSPSASSVGWTKDFKHFIPYDTGIAFDGQPALRPIFEAMRKKGNEAAWIACMKKLRLDPAVRLFTSASFASALIGPLGLQPFIMHLWGETGSGKTIALQAAASIWGDIGKGRLWRSMDSTDIGPLSVAPHLGGAPYLGDESQAFGKTKAQRDKFFMSCTEGMDRVRASRSGGMTVNRSWDCAFLFTGEEPLTDESSGGGTQSRIIEIGVGTRVIIPDPAEAFAALSANSGWGGPAFIRIIQEHDINDTRKIQASKREQLTRFTEGKQLMAGALVMAADYIAAKHIFHEDQLDAAIFGSVMKTCTEISKAARFMSWLRDWLAENSENFRICSRPKWGKFDDTMGTEQVYCIATVLEREAANAGFNFAGVKARLLQDGSIEPSGTRSTHVVRIEGINSRCVLFNL